MHAPMNGFDCINGVCRMKGNLPVMCFRRIMSRSKGNVDSNILTGCPSQTQGRFHVGSTINF